MAMQHFSHIENIGKLKCNFQDCIKELVHLQSACLFSHVWLCNPIDHSLPGFSVHGISQVRVLEWIAISYSGASSRSRDRTPNSCIGRWILYQWATRKSLYMCQVLLGFIWIISGPQFTRDTVSNCWIARIQTHISLTLEPVLFYLHFSSFNLYFIQ